ncbi:MAG TPA: zinc dependent phospholipase C family protein [Anaerolineae bacterium]|nr:zinc dependent phospholipase C family protein [Anaerolineae bacterium]
MAPFNTHFLVAEMIWPELDGPWQIAYGQFCFGCVAPDVDKISVDLRQRDTHFYDRTDPYEFMASHRSATFLARQAEFLRAPFQQLTPDEQAFVLGYLCHLCLDEVSKFMWQRETWLRFYQIGPGPAFAALDELARQKINDYAAIGAALDTVRPVAVVPVIPYPDLEKMLVGVRHFVHAPTLEEEYLALVDMFDRPTPEHRQEKRHQLRQNIPIARRRVHYFKLATLLRAGLARTRLRIENLLAGHVPEPALPEI